MKHRRFDQLDVFTDTPTRGNPLAVVHGADDLSEERMAAFACWTNLSETTFVLEPTDPRADYRVRIFTPTAELLFAGHPTLGTCHAWLAAGGVPRDPAHVVQQCGVGLVRIRRDGSRLAFAAPARRRSGALDEARVECVAGWLGVPRSAVIAHQHADNGPPWIAVMLRSAHDVLALRPQFGQTSEVYLGVVGAHPAGGDAVFEVRAFFPGANGMVEDPVTGSLNAALAQWLIDAGHAPERYVAAQGHALGRAGRVFVERDGDTIWIGGHVTGCIEGTVTL